MNVCIRIAAWGTLCLVLTWTTSAKAGIVTTGSIDDNPTVYLTHIHVAYVADGALAIDDDSDLARDIVNVGYVSGHTGTATVAGPGSTLKANNNSESRLYVGRSGHGILNVLGGGLVDGNHDYVGYAAGSLGQATVSGSGSSWEHNSLTIGYTGDGMLNVSDGGQVTTGSAAVGMNAGSTGAVTVSDPGSTWMVNSDTKIGWNGSGTMTIRNGATVTTGDGASGAYLGFNTGSSGTATICGAGSSWTTAAFVPFVVGNRVGGVDYGTGSLTLSDGGTIAVDSLSVNATSVVDAHVTGDDMIVVGSEFYGFHNNGSVANNGVIRFYASPSLATGVYSPISESGGQTITWSGSGAYEAIGGTWNDVDKTFVVSTTTLLNAGDVESVTSGERLLFTDPGSGKTVGASFGTVPDGTNFSASLLSPAELANLAAMPEVEGQVLAGWDFTTNLTGSDVSLTFDIGEEITDLDFWHLDGTWSSYLPDSFSYNASGKVDFTVSELSGYAVTGVVALPEPSTLSWQGGNEPWAASNWDNDGTPNQSPISGADMIIDIADSAVTVIADFINDGGNGTGPANSVFVGENDTSRLVVASGVTLEVAGESRAGGFGKMAIEESATLQTGSAVIEIGGRLIASVQGSATGLLDSIGQLSIADADAIQVDWLAGTDATSMFGGTYTVATYTGTALATTGKSANEDGNIGAAYVKTITYDVDVNSDGTLYAVEVELHPQGPGDANLDGKVDSEDLATFGLNWAPTGTDKTWFTGDFDFNGNVDSADLAAFGLAWAPTGIDFPAEAGITAVPEPGTVLMLLLAAAGLLIYGKRR